MSMCRAMLLMVGSASICCVPIAAQQLPQASAASSPDVTGQKYGDASPTLSDAGLEPVVSMTVTARHGRTVW